MNPRDSHIDGAKGKAVYTVAQTSLDPIIERMICWDPGRKIEGEEKVK